ncbi:MAG TPA: TonB-dependent siderophore receptor [Vicinamibacterales bacterium]
MFARSRVVVSRKRKKGAYRLFATTTFLMSAALADRPVAAAPQPQVPVARPAESVALDIPSGQLDVVLRALSAATGLTFDVRIPNDTLGMMHSPGVSGTMALDDAIARVLEGTSLAFRRTGSTVVVEVQRLSEAVEVTGKITGLSTPKLTEPLRDIPQTITVIPRAVMEEQGATTLRDVLRNVAGITFQAGEGGVPAGDQLSIRGFSARTDMFVDGVRDFGGYSRDSFNLEQVEVAKGPTSSLAGRGSTGGAINQVSKAPNLSPTADATIGAGNASYQRTTIDFNQPLQEFAVPGTAVRINAMWTDIDVPNRDRVSSARWGVAPSIGFGAGTKTRATVSYFKLKQDNQPDYGLPWVPVNTNPELAEYSNGAPPVEQSNYYGLVTRDYEKTDTDLATVEVSRDLGATTVVRNLTRWGQNVRDSVITAPRFVAVNTSTAINRQLQSRDMTDDILANQTNLTSRVTTGSIGHAVVAGVELSSESSINYARTGPTAPTADLYDPNPNDPYPGPIVRSGASTDGTANSAAAYLFDTVSIGSHLELTGGLRWDRFAVDYVSTASDGVATAFGREDNMTSGRAGVIYKPRPEGSIYVGYGTSFNPSAEGLSLSAANVALEPEKSRNIEAGTKWDLLRQQLSATAAIFRTDKTNARTPGVNPGDPPTVLAGKQRVSGVEFGLSGRIRSWWTTIANYAHMTSDIEASNTPAEVDQNLALTPENTLSLWTTFDLPRGIGVGGGAQFMDSVFRNATNTTQVPSYWLINATASYAVNSHMTLRFNASNLIDEQYVDRVGGGHYVPGPGRQMMVTATIRR